MPIISKNAFLCLCLTVLFPHSLQAAETVDAETPPSHKQSSINYQSQWSCGDGQNFAWYCDAQEPPKKAQEPEGNLKPEEPPKTAEELALEKMDALHKEVQAKEALAILDPTPQHVKDYVMLQNKVMQQASVFTNVWQRTIWQDPSTNISGRPVNAVALQEYDHQKKVAENKTVNDLTREWGIFFIFRSDCPYCHRESKILNMLNHQYGMTVFPISIDGLGLPEYPNPTPDNGMASELGVTTVPQMYLGNIKDHRMIPLGTGVVAMDDLVNRIYTLTQTKPGDE